MSSLEFMIIRIEAMDKRIGELEKSNLLYAMMLFNIDMLPEDDPHYNTCKDIKDNN